MPCSLALTSVSDWCWKSSCWCRKVPFSLYFQVFLIEPEHRIHAVRHQLMRAFTYARRGDSSQSQSPDRNTTETRRIAAPDSRHSQVTTAPPNVLYTWSHVQHSTRNPRKANTRLGPRRHNQMILHRTVLFTFIGHRWEPRPKHRPTKDVLNSGVERTRTHSIAAIASWRRGLHSFS